MNIREFDRSEKDIDGIVRLINQFDNLPNAITKKDIRDSLALVQKDRSMLFIVEMNEQIIGYAFLEEMIFVGFGKFIELQQIMIDEKHRHLGIGQQLLKKCESWGIGMGYKNILLSSRVHLTNAHKFYEKMGYRVTRQSYFFQKELK